jgi:phosphatidylinositol alpha-1,6-mannosyltransferase
VRGRSVGVEVIGDPATVFAKNAFDHSLRPIIRAGAIGLQSQLCRHASAVLYVSESLRCRYKTEADGVVVSDVGLCEAAYATNPRGLVSSKDIRVINVGTFEQTYKGQDVLLRAVARLAARPNAPRVSVAFVGAGRHQAACVALAAKLNLTQQVQFHGHVSSAEALRALLDASDVMVHASYTEGMPRVIIEAMARGLPCISTRVGGVPEILDDAWLVPAGDEVAMGKAILDLVRSPDEYARQSRLNLERSRLHSEAAMQVGYDKFLKPLSGNRR